MRRVKRADCRLLPDLKEKLGLLNPKPSTWAISMVPAQLRSLREDPYSPRTFSIGPYHHRKGKLQAMNAHKLKYVLYLLHRTYNPEGTLDQCGEAIQNMYERVRACYADDIDNFVKNANELLEILVVDGCFIIELFYRQVIERDTNLNDPIASNVWMMSSVRHDLLLLDNQIPFFIIVKLYDIIKQQQPQPQSQKQRFNIPPEHSLPSLALSFFHPEMDFNKESDVPSSEPNHLLDLLHKFWVPKSDMGQSSSKIQGFDRCASELIKAGIQFEKNDSHHLLDIKFDNGVLKIPPLSIHKIELRLRSLIAMEQCGFNNGGNTFPISSYALMMKSLIRSSVDAKLLQQRGIICTDLEKGGSALLAINGICKNVDFGEHFYFDNLCKEVKDYNSSRCHWQRQKAIWTVNYHTHLAELKRDYFSNPWKAIGFLAALVLLILTGLQTFYTVRSYYPH